KVDYFNTKPENSTLKLLNESLGKSPFTLGISSDDKKQKVLYLLDKDFLKFSTNESTPLERSSYFAIKPYSNKLWSGDYKLKSDVVPTSFASIDLDRGLSLILSKIDDLLTPSNIKALSTDYVE